MRNLTNSLNCDRADKECFRLEAGVAGLPCEVGENSEKRALPQTIIVLGSPLVSSLQNDKEQPSVSRLVPYACLLRNRIPRDFLQLGL